ncbi:MAG: hypothetical protein HGA85_04250 [Nanoarchaeota archaeon]|nr:hypothetical protein [Nanoarchaeota archaeon]
MQIITSPYGASPNFTASDYSVFKEHVRNAVTNNWQSGYPVKELAVDQGFSQDIPSWVNQTLEKTLRRYTFLGGNFEYGLGRGVHGEHSSLTHAAQEIGHALNNYWRIVTLYIDVPGRCAPCGDCRDFMLSLYEPMTRGLPLLGENFEIVSSDENRFYVVKFPELLFPLNKMKMAQPSEVAMVLEYQEANEMARKSVHAPWLPAWLANYTAVAAVGKGVPGSLFVGVDFHGTYPIGSILSKLIEGEVDPEKIEYLAIISEDQDNLPEVLYKDRQDSLYLNTVLAAARKQDDLDLPVYIVSEKGFGRKTSVKEWLPMPFSPDLLFPFGDNQKRFNGQLKNLFHDCQC